MPRVRSVRRSEKIRAVLTFRQPGLTLVMENIHDPHNVSAVLRSCDAVGIMRVELLYSVEKFPRIGKKSSSSANKWLETRRHTTVDACYRTLRTEGYRILATRIEKDTPSLYECDLTANVALVFGNEHRGVSDDAAVQADGLFQIPMLGMIQSLNVSVAAAVCLYEALRQRWAAGMYDHAQLPPELFQTMLDDWLSR